MKRRSVPPRSGGDVLQLEVLDVDPLRAERLRYPRQDAGAVGDVDAQLLEGAEVGVRLRQHAPAVATRLADPACEEAGVAGVERLLQLLDAAAVLDERLADGAGVLQEDVDPDPRIRAGDAGHVPERSPRSGGERLVPVDPRGPGLVDKQVGKRMGKVAGQGDEAVVDGRVDGDGRGAERCDEAVDEAVRRGGGLGVGVRNQEAPSNRSARACAGPCASEPQTGWPPTNLGEGAAAATRALVEPTSVTEQPLDARGEDRLDRMDELRNRTRRRRTGRRRRVRARGSRRPRRPRRARRRRRGRARPDRSPPRNGPRAWRRARRRRRSARCR